MKIKHWTDVPAEPAPGLDGVTTRWVLAEQDDAPHFALRVIEVQPGLATPYHTHWWEHEVFILNGKGSLVMPESETPLSPGMTILVEGNETHQFRNAGDEVLRFICLIPHEWLEGLAEKHASQTL